MTNPRFDPKINWQKGLNSGTQAAVVAAATNLLVVIGRNLFPTVSEADLISACSSVSIIGAAVIAALITMHNNRVKHGG